MHARICNSSLTVLVVLRLPLPSETTKRLLEYLTEVSSAPTEDGDVTLAAKLLASSPVLEAFGNAKTVRNDNSSRFGALLTPRTRPRLPCTS